MAVSNKSNKSSKSNKSNKSSSGSGLAELDSLGDETSLSLSAALHGAMYALSGPEQAIDQPPPPMIERDYFRGLNPRHRMHLILRKLEQGLEVRSIAPGSPGRLTAELRLQGRLDPLVRLTHRHDATTLAFWQGQVSELRAMRWYREERLPEIQHQQSDILSFMGLGAPIGPDTHPWVLVLLDAVLELAFRVGAELKAAFRAARPEHVASDLAPVIRTPAHSSFPAGHSTEVFAVATVLTALFPNRRDSLRRLAVRIATNRSYAGVHFPVDNHAGAVLGDVLGALVLARVFGTDEPQGIPDFEAGVDAGPASPLGTRLDEYALKVLPAGPPPQRVTSAGVADPELKWLAELALAELAGVP